MSNNEIKAGIQKNELEIVEKIMQEVLGKEIVINSTPERLGGMNNKNYLVKTNKGSYVFRLPGKGSNESVDRVSEFKNAELAYDIGLNCETLYFNHDTGIKITRYIEESETLKIETSETKENMTLMAQALRKLHTSNVRFLTDFEPLVEVDSYLKTIKENNEELLKHYVHFDDLLSFVSKESERYPLDLVPCHLDAWPENFIKDSEGIYLIDWEYSANFDKLWDVVSISLECGYSVEKQNEFNFLYFNRENTAEEGSKMSYMRVLMDFYWSMWALSKVSLGDDTLLEYGIDRFNRGQANSELYKKMYID